MTMADFYYSISSVLYMSRAFGLTYFGLEGPMGARKLVSRLTGRLYIVIVGTFSLTSQFVCFFAITCYHYNVLMEFFFEKTIHLYSQIFSGISLIGMFTFLSKNSPNMTLLTSFSNVDVKFGQHYLHKMNKT